MFILIFENHVTDTVELITAIPKLHRQPKRIHYDKLRPIAEEFAKKRVVQMRYRDGLPIGPRMLDEYDVVWDCWETRGIAGDDDWLIKCIDTDIGYPGICLGPKWDGIECIQTPVTDWLAGVINDV